MKPPSATKTGKYRSSGSAAAIVGERRAHVGLALGDGLLRDDLTTEGGELVGEDLLEGLGVRAAVVDRGSRLDALLVERPLGDGLALERVAVRGAGVAGVRRVAVLGGQRRARVRRRDRRQARIGQGLDAADGLVGAGRADEADDRGVGRQLLGGRGAAFRRAQAVFGRQRDVVVEKLAALVLDRDLDAALRVLTKGRVGAREDAPIRDVDRIPGRDRRRCRARRTAPPPRRCRRRAQGARQRRALPPE